MTADDRSSPLVVARVWHAVGLLDHLDANYRRARRPDHLGSWQALSVKSTVVHVSDRTFLLLYGVDI